MSCSCPCHKDDGYCEECCDGGPDAVAVVQIKGGSYYEDKWGPMVAELKRFREREPLVQELISWVAPRDGEGVSVFRDVDNECVAMAESIRDFKLTEDKP